MSNDLERLDRLIERAATALTKATTAAEFLEARMQADVAYSAAKKASHLHKIKDAHDVVHTACRKVMADALVIDAAAQCRLADEYDAAQERGEVNKAGQPKKSIIPNKNNTSVEDIGLTRKQVHEARTVRDAEKAKPGIVRKTVEDKLAENKEPTRADVKRAIKGKPKDGPKRTAGPKPERKKYSTEAEKKAASLVLDQGLTRAKAAAETGLTQTVIRLAVAEEMGERKGKAEPNVDRADLSMSAQQRLDAALRQYQRKLDDKFEQRVHAEVKSRLDEMILPHWKKQIDEARRIFDRRKGILKSKREFNLILGCLHPDSRLSVTDDRLNEAFRLFNSLEKFMLDESLSPTQVGVGLPRTMAEWDKMKAAATAARKAKRATNNSAVRTR